MWAPLLPPLSCTPQHTPRSCPQHSSTSDSTANATQLSLTSTPLHHSVLPLNGASPLHSSVIQHRQSLPLTTTLGAMHLHHLAPQPPLYTTQDHHSPPLVPTHHHSLPPHVTTTAPVLYSLSTIKAKHHAPPIVCSHHLENITLELRLSSRLTTTLINSPSREIQLESIQA